MGCFKLIAVGLHAKQLHLCNGGPDLLLWPDKPILLGRAVKDGEGYRYPNAWNSLSSRHATLSYQPDVEGEGHWLVTDHSTNGTFINGAKVGKGNSAVLRAGDKLGLSIIQPATANPNVPVINTVEYQLAYEPDAPAPSSSAAHAAAPKRKKETSASPTPGPSGGPKRQRSDTESAELLHLRKANEELRQRNGEYRHEMEQLEQQLQERDTKHSQDKQALEEQLRGEMAAAAEEAAEALTAEKSRSKQLSDRIEEMTASHAEQQRQLQAQLDGTSAQLAARIKESEGLLIQLEQAQEAINTRDSDISRLQAQAAAQQLTVAELQLELAKRSEAASALHEAQSTLEKVTQAREQAVQQLQQEQKARAAAQTVASKAQNALRAAMRAKTAIHEKLDNEREKLMLSSRHVQQAHQGLLEQVWLQHEENERQRRVAEEMRQTIKTLLEQATSEASRQSSTASALVQAFEEHLVQLAAANEAAGLSAALGDGTDGLDQMDEDGGTPLRGQDHALDGEQHQELPMTQPMSGGQHAAPAGSTPNSVTAAGADANANAARGAGADCAATPATSVRGPGDTPMATPAGTQEQGADQPVDAAAAAAEAAAATAAETAGYEAPGTDETVDAAQAAATGTAGMQAGLATATQEVFIATMAYPMATAAAATGAATQQQELLERLAEAHEQQQQQRRSAAAVEEGETGLGSEPAGTQETEGMDEDQQEVDKEAAHNGSHAAAVVAGSTNLFVSDSNEEADAGIAAAAAGGPGHQQQQQQQGSAGTDEGEGMEDGQQHRHQHQHQHTELQQQQHQQHQNCYAGQDGVQAADASMEEGEMNEQDEQEEEDEEEEEGEELGCTEDPDEHQGLSQQQQQDEQQQHVEHEEHGQQQQLGTDGLLEQLQQQLNSHQQPKNLLGTCSPTRIQSQPLSDIDINANDSFRGM